MTTEFTIPGTPQAKQRPRFSRRGSYVTSYTPEMTVNYENLVKVSWANANADMKLTGALGAEVKLFFPIPKSVSKKKRLAMEIGTVYHTKKPDVDNCLKSIFDALNGIAYDDDSQIVAVTAAKFYSENPRAWVKITELES